MRVQLDITNTLDCEWIESLPKDKKSDILRTCITIGRLSIENSKIHIDDSKYLEPIIEKFRDITNSNVEKTLDTIKDTIKKIEESKLCIDSVSKNIMEEVKKNSSTMVDCIKEQSNLTEKILIPITSRIDKMNTEVEKIFSIKSSSNTKGKLGESIVEQHITSAFPHYEVINMSQMPHEADYHVITDFGKVLLEIKTYSHNVTKEQIEKFYNDIDRTSIPFAIFLSTTSGICGKKHMEWEVYGKSKTIILFFPNSSFHLESIVFSFLFLKSLYELGIHKPKDTCVFKTNDDIMELFKLFDDFYIELTSLIEKQSKLKYQISTTKTSINKLIDELYKQCFDLEIEQSSIIKSIYSKIKSSMIQYNFSIENYTKLDSSLDFDNYIDSLCLKQNISSVLIKMYSFTQEIDKLQLYKEKESSKMILIYEDTIICSVIIQKTKVDLIFDLSKDCGCISLNPKFEIYKNNQIILTLDNTLDVIEYTKERILSQIKLKHI